MQFERHCRGLARRKCHNRFAVARDFHRGSLQGCGWGVLARDEIAIVVGQASVYTVNNLGFS